MGNFIGDNNKGLSGEKPDKKQTKSDQEEALQIAFHGSKDGRTIFKAAVNKTVEDVNSHGSLTEIRIGFFLRGKNQHKKIDQ